MVSKKILSMCKLSIINVYMGFTHLVIPEVYTEVYTICSFQRIYMDSLYNVFKGFVQKGNSLLIKHLFVNLQMFNMISTNSS